ncbi:hypothetical protein [Mycolicibacterium fluoranthenivorans]|uniref:Cytochrome c biogenesis protein CcdA n=1 Tax=Mycolicibacterium fluoranthenivorans TaxID=258505 RepID=A0A7X5U484_9MYCO|nr:hypothetical protein [Mycolicibacterium fluoranthenivorans]MCV7358466.1 hypothetical protein [Mycolicibacterium fluoranthenivorans]NIH98042.1 cytochrome c biogenesis protein CcdA [Mycolicibacterium fluoranthenivorans]
MNTIIKARENAKALATLMGSLATFLAAVNAPPQWQLWVGGSGVVLTSLATWGVPNRPRDTATPVDERVIGDVQAAVQDRDAQAAAAADADTRLGNILQGITEVIGATPVVGPGAAAAVDLVEAFLKSSRR